MNAKYEFVENDTVKVNGKTLKRIRALVAIAAYCVLPGDIGGYIETEVNLSVHGDAWVSDNARVYGDAQVYGNARVYGDARVHGDAWVSDNARVYGDAQVYGDAWVYGDAQVYGNAQVHGDAQVSPIVVSGLLYDVTILDTHMAIGCQYHSLKNWSEFDNNKIIEIDGKNALRFWMHNKDSIIGLARASGRIF